MGSIPGSGRVPGEGNGRQPTLTFLPGEFHGQRSLTGCGPWGRRESDTTERLTRSLFTLKASHILSILHAFPLLPSYRTWISFLNPVKACDLGKTDPASDSREGVFMGQSTAFAHDWLDHPRRIFQGDCCQHRGKYRP